MVKEKRKINAIDIFLILFAVGIIIATFMRSENLLNIIFGNTYNATYTIKLEMVDRELVKTAKVGDVVLTKDDGAKLGTVLEMETQSSQITITTASGSEVVGTLKDKFDIILKINADVLKKDSAYILGNDIVLQEKAEMYVFIGEICAKATIIDVDFAEMTKK